MASEKILIVDREQPSRDRLSGLLRQEGYSVEGVSGEEDALRLLAYRAIDLVLADLPLDEMGGLHLLDQIQQRSLQIPLIVLSATQDAARAVYAIRSGAVDVVLKPFDPIVLLGSVARAITRGTKDRQAEVIRDGLENLVKNRTRMLQEAISELERSYDTTLEALGDALDLKDSETEGHSRRVTAYTIALASSMGVSANELKIIKHGAYLHDIGKMAVPDKILLKPGRLDTEETERMRQHCYAGYQIVRKIPFLRDAAEIVHCHQEHYDGGGYPQHLKGEQIPLGARIFAVADALDAITSDRPYRKGRSYEVAQEEIARFSGTQFDPRVVKAFLSLPIGVWEELRESIQAQD